MKYLNLQRDHLINPTRRFYNWS